MLIQGHWKVQLRMRMWASGCDKPLVVNESVSLLVEFEFQVNNESYLRTDLPTQYLRQLYPVTMFIVNLKSN